MSEENVELVRSAYAAWQQGDDSVRSFVRAHYAPDAVLHPLADFPEARIQRGHDEIISGFMEMREAAERSEMQVEELVDAGDQVVAGIVFRAVIRGTQDELEARGGSIFTVREGKISEIRSFRTFAEALEAAGMSE